jgi:hypothetical protein
MDVKAALIIFVFMQPIYPVKAEGALSVDALTAAEKVLASDFPLLCVFAVLCGIHFMAGLNQSRIAFKTLCPNIG